MLDERTGQSRQMSLFPDDRAPLPPLLFAHLRQRWADLFDARYDILLYDLTSTYFECDVPADENDPRKFG